MQEFRDQIKLKTTHFVKKCQRYLAIELKSEKTNVNCHVQPLDLKFTVGVAIRLSMLSILR